MSTLKKVFGTPREERSEEFFENNLWFGQTAAEARWQKTMRIVVTTMISALLALAYFY